MIRAVLQQQEAATRWKLEVRILTKHRLVIESYLDTVEVGGPGGEAHTEPGPAQRLHLGRDIEAGPSHHQDLEVALPSLGGINCVRVRGKYYCQLLQTFYAFHKIFSSLQDIPNKD